MCVEWSEKIESHAEDALHFVEKAVLGAHVSDFVLIASVGALTRGE